MPSSPRSEWQIKALHKNVPSEGNDKFYAVRIDLVSGQYSVSASWGKADAAREQSCKLYSSHPTLSAARRVMDSMLNKKEREGYVDIESSAYRSYLRLDKVLTMIDSSRIYGYSDVTPPPIPNSSFGTTGTAPRSGRQRNSASNTSNEPARARRDINL